MNIPRTDDMRLITTRQEVHEQLWSVNWAANSDGEDRQYSMEFIAGSQNGERWMAGVWF